MALPDLKDPKAHLAQKAHQDKTDNPVHPANLDLQALPARRVSARNTVPSTVVCSSKTAPDDKFRISELLHHIQVSSTLLAGFPTRVVVSFVFLISCFSSSPSFVSFQNF